MNSFEWKLIGGVLLVIAAGVALHWYDGKQQKVGAQDCMISTQSQQIASTAAVAASVATETTRNTGLSKTLEAEKVNSGVKYETIHEHTLSYSDRPVYSNVCIDAAGLLDVNAALLPASGAASGSDR